MSNALEKTRNIIKFKLLKIEYQLNIYLLLNYKFVSHAYKDLMVSCCICSCLTSI